jgi:hypothetical protein
LRWRRIGVVLFVERVVDAEVALVRDDALEDLLQVGHLLVADARRVRSGRGDGQEQRLLARASRRVEDVPQVARAVRVELVDDGQVHVQPVERLRVGRQRLGLAGHLRHLEERDVREPSLTPKYSRNSGVRCAMSHASRDTIDACGRVVAAL